MKKLKIKVLLFFIFACLMQVHAQKKIVNNLFLPKVKDLKYVVIPTALERIYPNSFCQDSLPKLLKNYHRRLKDIGGYEVYLIQLNCHDIQKNSCMCFNGISELEYKLLLLRNKKTKQGKVLIVSYTLLSDSEYYDMNYTLKANQIILKESGFTEGDNGTAEPLTRTIHKIKIFNNKQLSISTIEK